jgi:hypothetical protein
MFAQLRALFAPKPALSPEEQLAAAVAAEFARHGLKPKSFDAERYQFEFDGAFVALGNLYDAWRLAEPAKRGELVERFVRGFRETGARFATFAEVEKLLSPLVRSKAEVCAFELAASNAKSANETVKFPYAILAGDLVIALGVDLRDSILRVSQQHLEQWGVTFDDALAIALGNFQRRSFLVEFARSPIGHSVFEATKAEDDQSSTLVLPPSEFFRFPMLEGDPVVVAPSRNHLFLTGSRNEDGLAAIANFVAGILPQTPHRCSVEMLRLADGAWVSWRPEGRAMAVYRAALRQRDALDYESQKQQIEEMRPKTGEEAFVSKLVLFSRGGEATTLAVWPEAVSNGLLPRADIIAFHPKSAEGAVPVTVPWETAVPIVEELLAPEPDLYPPRWRYRAFPDAAALAALREGAVEVRG